MGLGISTNSALQSTERIGQGAIYGESQRQSPHTALIHILDDDSLLNIFYLYRPAIFDGDESKEFRIQEGGTGIVSDGGTNSHKSAKDGENRYLDLHPTCVFVSSVYMTRQLQTCWHSHLLSLSSSIALVTSPQKMKTV